jgi:hypothetical protein
VRGIQIDLCDVVTEMKLLKQVCIIFLDALPTVNRSFRSHLNRVLREGRGDGGGIVFVVCLIFSFNEASRWFWDPHTKRKSKYAKELCLPRGGSSRKHVMRNTEPPPQSSWFPAAVFSYNEL